MPALTDASIRAAMRAAKPRTISDGGSRGQGRLILSVRPTGAAVAAEWYAQSWRAGRRSLSKLGSYPDVTLADARLRFAREYAGKDISKPIRRAGSVGDLFEAYVASLRARGAPSADDVDAKLQDVGAAFGRARAATAITTEDVVDVLRPIYARGAASMADHVRGYIRAAFAWGMRSERDYRVQVPARFCLQANPAAEIPTEPKAAGTRWLTPPEFVTVWRFLEQPTTPIYDRNLIAIRVIMATGQRVTEIASLRASQYDRDRGLIEWPNTKNGRPHVIPLPAVAIDLLNGLPPTQSGWLFPAEQEPTKPVTSEVLYSCVWRARSRMPIAPFALRDLRRTWKTLAGQAGVSKDDRDRLQNHGRSDVSSRHYDRWEYLPEKTAAMARWSAWLDSLLARGHG